MNMASVFRYEASEAAKRASRPSIAPVSAAPRPSAPPRPSVAPPRPSVAPPRTSAPPAQTQEIQVDDILEAADKLELEPQYIPQRPLPGFARASAPPSHAPAPSQAPRASQPVARPATPTRLVALPRVSAPPPRSSAPPPRVSAPPQMSAPPPRISALPEQPPIYVPPSAPPPRYSAPPPAINAPAVYDAPVYESRNAPSVAPVEVDIDMGDFAAAPRPRQKPVADSTMQIILDLTRVPLRTPKRRLGWVVALTVGIAVIILGVGVTKRAMSNADEETRATLASMVAPQKPTTTSTPQAPTPPKPTPAATQTPASTSTVGTLIGPAGRVYIDGKKLQGSSAIVPCGSHKIRIAPSLKTTAMDVPCGGELKL
jgi:hypothetical protein